MNEMELNFLRSLANQYPTIASASTEIINLQSILNLPKGTEHFMTDIHGESEQFNHILKNGSGSVRRKINEEFGNTMSERDKKALATLIYYPKEKLDIVLQSEDNIEDWYKITLHRLVQITKRVASKYTRSKVRKALPADFAYIIEELITEKAELSDKEAYYNEIIHTIIRLDRAQEFITALSYLIQRLVIDHLHIVGDIYDRGPGPHVIMDTLNSYHSVDVQWGNHDVVWMGAAAGQPACIATVIRNSIRYGNLDILEDGYGINMMPLATFAMEAYKEDACSIFALKGKTSINLLEEELGRKMHKAIAVLQFKLEGQLVRRRTSFHMENRALLHRIDPEKGTVTLPDGTVYPMRDCSFPTIDWADPYALTEAEQDVMERLSSAFRNCEKLQNHIRFLLDKGGLYKTYNGNLLFHGSIPLNEDGTFREVDVYGEKYRGKELYDVLEAYVRRGFYSVDEEEREKGRDIMWYIWAGPDSPLFGKDKMTTFERYFIEEKETHTEKKRAYYQLLEKEEVVDLMLEEFGLDPKEGHIINGHVPVHQSEGENPVKCSGKIIVIDGGFSKAYRKVTGIAGYTLVYSSYGLFLSAHEPFTSAEDAVLRETDIVSNQVAVHYTHRRRLVGDTDNGKALKERITELTRLLDAYRKGVIKEKK